MIRKWFLSLKDYIQHIILAAAFGGIVFLLLIWLPGSVAAVWAGWFAGTMYFYGRETRDAQNLDPSLEDKWRSFNPFAWPSDPRSDFLWPAGVNLLVAVILTLFLR